MFPDDIRIGDAERRELADVLATHYADGRLDEAEFQERVGKAMAARTRRDLKGLLADLPSLAPESSDHLPYAHAHPHRRGRALAVGLVLVALVVAVHFAVGLFLVPWHGAWLLVLLACAVVLHHHRRHHVTTPPSGRQRGILG